MPYLHGTMEITGNGKRGRAWSCRDFIDRFTAAKAWAVENLTGHNPADLQIRDIRRTAVVRLGELNLEDALIAAITGHKLATVKKILETYMPRTIKMAARAVVARMADRREAAAAEAKKEGSARPGQEAG